MEQKVMAGVDLKPAEAALVVKLRHLLGKVLTGLRFDLNRATYVEMTKKARQLHAKLATRGIRPVIEDGWKGLSDPEAYTTPFEVEALIRFVADTNANNRPNDKTMGAEFEFRVYSRRWGHDDLYRMRRTKKGWEVKHTLIGGPCNRGGQPYLFENLEHDSIEYPCGLHTYIENLWGRAARDGLSR